MWFLNIALGGPNLLLDRLVFAMRGLVGRLNFQPIRLLQSRQMAEATTLVHRFPKVSSDY